MKKKLFKQQNLLITQIKVTCWMEVTILFQVKPLPSRVKYRTYSPTTLTNAYLAVKEGGSSVHKASKQFGIPMQTIRDRTSGRIDQDCVTTGSLLCFLQKKRLNLWSV